MTEENVTTAAAGQNFGRVRQRPVLFDQKAKGCFAIVIDIDIQGDEAGLDAGHDSDVCRRPATPASCDPVRVDAGVVQTLRDARMLTRCAPAVLTFRA